MDQLPTTTLSITRRGSDLQVAVTGSTIAHRRLNYGQLNISFRTDCIVLSQAFQPHLQHGPSLFAGVIEPSTGRVAYSRYVLRAACCLPFTFSTASPKCLLHVRFQLL